MQQLLFINNRYVQQWFIGQNQMRRLYGLTSFGMSLALSPDGQTFVTGDGSSQVWLWQTDNGKLLRFLGRHGSPWGVRSVLFSPDGDFVVSASNDGGIYYWAIDGTFQSQIFGDMNSDRLALSPTEPILAYDAHCCNFVGVQLVYFGETTPFLDLPTPDEAIPDTLTFSPDGRILGIGSRKVEGDVWLFDVTTGQLLRTLVIETESYNYVQGITFSPDGQILAVAYYDQTIRLWRVSDGTLLHTFAVPHGTPTTILFSSDGQKLFGGGRDGVIRIWGITS